MNEVQFKQLLTTQPPPDASVRAWLRVLVLAGLGVYFAYNIYTGKLANYINERFVWLSYTATALFLLLALAAVVRNVKRGPEAAHSISTGAVITWGVLITAAIPLVFGVMVPSQPLGADAINGNISTTAVRGTNQKAFTIAPENRNVLDWLRSFNDSDDFSTFNGQPVNLVGFVYREPDFDSNEFMVARFTLSCCVADASALGLPVRYEAAASLTEGDWVQITGELRVEPFGEDEMPVIQVASVKQIEQPEHPYLYP
jgi:putative membrane protein